MNTVSRLSMSVLGFLASAFAGAGMAGAADTIEELQAEINAHLASPAVRARIAVENAVMDQACASRAQDPSGMVLDLGGGHQLRNHAEFAPGIRRFEFPTIEALFKAHEDGVCGLVVSLNAECQMRRFDRSGDARLSSEEESFARMTLGRLGYPAPMIDELVQFYQRNGRVCLSPFANPWHSVLEAREPEHDVAQIFAAVELIRQAKVRGEKACVHCSYGKHRTGLMALLIELASLPAENPTVEEIQALYQRYLKHAWFGDCMSRIQTLEIVPLILASKPYGELRARWRAR